MRSVLLPRPLLLAALLGLVHGGCMGTRAQLDGPAPHRLTALPLSDRSLADVEGELRASVESERPFEVPPRLFDQYIAQAFDAVPDPALLWAGFRRVLTHASQYEGDTARAHVAQHLALSELLYRDAPPTAEGLQRRADHALSWWLEHHGAPASDVHPRLTEHLKRVATARAEFPASNSATGLDARGETLVRYGRPSRTRQVSFNDAQLLRSYFQEGLAIRYADFPRNEVWMYDQLGDEALFLFVEGRRGEGFHLGAVNDLLPRQLRNRGMSGSARGNSFAMASLSTMRFIFSQLALFHPAYSSRFDAVAEYVGWQEERAIGARAGGRVSTPVAGFGAAPRMLELALERNQREDVQIADRREAILPNQYDHREPIPAALPARTARFLDEGGGTQLLVYWKAPHGWEGGGRLRSRLLRYPTPFDDPSVLLDLASEAAPEGGGVSRAEVALDHAMARFTIQMDRPAPRGGGIATPSTTATFSTEEVAPLSDATETLEMSDLLPFRVDDVAAQGIILREGFSRSALQPYLSASLAGQPALGVYFEVYDRSAVRGDVLITYQIVKRRRGRFLQRRRVEDTAFLSRRAAGEQRLPAVFLIDRAEWADADEVEVVVTITDGDTGEEISRALTFSLTP